MPYLQVAMEVLEQIAPDLAVELELEESAVGWGLLKVFRWGLGRCPDDAPPSVNAVVTGPNAARLIVKAAGLKVDPEAFAEACCNVHPEPVLKRTPDGIRLCGLSRYDAAWGKSHKDVWPAWKAFLDEVGPDPRLSRSECVPKAERKLSESVPNAVPQTQTQIQTHSLPSEEREALAPVSKVPVTLAAPTKPPDSWDGDDFWAWAQSIRQDGGLVAEAKPGSLSLWFNRALMTEGVTAESLKEAFYAFGEDKHWEKHRYPFSAFMKQWASFARKDVTRAAS